MILAVKKQPRGVAINNYLDSSTSVTGCIALTRGDKACPLHREIPFEMYSSQNSVKMVYNRVGESSGSLGGAAYFPPSPPTRGNV